jgi:NAD(P)-dependent dehydrogenase (short-subunit alcohol dehydrogenase family)
VTRLQGKSCFITAGAQGIGCAIAMQFASEGAAVNTADLRHDERSAPHPNIRQVTLDATNEAEVGAIAAGNPDIFVLVNCVGFVLNGTALDISMADFDRTMEIKVRSMVLTTRAFLPAMFARGDGAASMNVESARAAFMARQPMGILGHSDEIAAAAVLLASDEARFMTGSNIVIDGGMSP